LVGQPPRPPAAAAAATAAEAVAPACWRCFDVTVPLSQDAGKDSHVVTPAVFAALRLRLRECQVPRAVLSTLSPTHVLLVRKSLDARRSRGSSEPRFSYVLDVRLALPDACARPGLLERAPEPPPPPARAPLPRAPERVLVVGAGPAGLFAALRLAESGVAVTLLERGQPVELRGAAIGRLFARRLLDGESNLCYGEGGAGTWSDGKLTSRIGRNSDGVRGVLATLVRFGAPDSILTDGKPHLGTDRLVRLLAALRAALLAAGAELRWGVRVEGLRTGGGGALAALRLAGGEELPARRCVLAVGHSSRPLYAALLQAGVALQAQGCAVGFRVEHPQALVDRAQYGPTLAAEVARGAGKLPVADYRLVSQPGPAARPAYSFCMCPGGQIVPTSTDPAELCVNGMSFSKRASPWANSGLVVPVTPADYAPFARPGREALAGVDFQAAMERAAAVAGGGALVAPVQRCDDFLAGAPAAADAPASSYRLGVRGAALHRLYPEAVTEALRAALAAFERRLPGYASAAGLLHGVETRTSAPLRILRGEEDRMSPSTPGLFPCGEGAGYAGGIVSAALDGVAAADALMADMRGEAPPAASRPERDSY